MEPRPFSVTPWLVAATLVAGCAAQRAQGPLDVKLGLSPAQATRAVRAYDFCPSGEPEDPHRQIFPQCGRPGVGFGDAWVVAHYRDGRTVRWQRFERWADRDRATARWSQLVDKRTALGPPTSAARDQVFARQGLPDGTKAWVAFARGQTLVGLYLLTTTDPSEPAILEEILPIDDDAP